MAMCVMAVVGAAPCQCLTPGGIQTTSPGRISSTCPPSRWTLPQPAVTISVWPSGWVCHAVRAPGSKVTLEPFTRAGSGALNKGSMRTVPVNQSDGPLPEGCEPLRLMSMGLSIKQEARLSPRSASISRHRRRSFGANLQIVVTHEPVEGDRTDPAQRENAYDDVAKQAEIVIDGANFPPKSATVRQSELVANEIERFQPAD